MEKSNNLSLVIRGPNDLILTETPLPDKPKSDEVQLASHTVGICGSDIHFWTHGRLDDWIIEEPMISGHESSAVVIGVGEDVTHLKVGDRVSVEPGVACLECDYCKEDTYNLCDDMIFQSCPPFDGSLRRYYNHKAFFCHKIPDSMTFEEGAIIEPLAVAVHSCQRAGINKNCKPVMITGAGPVGLLCALVAKAFGAQDICILDININRLKFAKSIGIEKTILIEPKDSEESVAKKVHKLFGGPPGVTMECTGVEFCINLAIIGTRNGGTVLIIGLNHKRVNISMSSAGHRELNLLGNRRYCKSFPVAIDLVSSGQINVRPLISHLFKLEDGIKAFETAKKCADGVIKVQIVCQ